MQRIVEVGSYPPPHAGNSVHMERLVDRLVQDGHEVTVIDPYAVETCLFARGKTDGAGGASPVSRRRGWWTLGRNLAAHADRNLVHFHMSAGKRFYGIARLLLFLTRSARRCVLTIHSGSFLGEFRRLGPFRRAKALRALRAFDDVICVNAEQEAFLRELIPSRLHVIPAFLPCPARPNPRIPEAVEELFRQTDAAVLTSGSGEPVYDFATVLRGVELAQRRTSARLGLIVSTYKAWDPAYWGGIQRALAQSPVRTVVTRDLRPDEFVLLAGRSRTYVRGSLTDGDAMAIREAAAAGAQILATDAVARPEGTALFPTGNPEQLSDLLLRAVADRDVGRLPNESAADNYGRIREVYGLPQPVRRELASMAR